MRKIRIVLGSNDGENILQDHMGMARDFYIFDLFEDGNSIFVEKRENILPEEDENESNHGDEKKLKSAVRLFDDCDVVLGRRGSPNFVKMRDNTKFQPVLTKVNALSALMPALAKSFEEIHGLVEQRKRGERPRNIPTVGRE